MDKVDVEGHLKDSWERSEIVHDLREVVEAIEANVPGPKTKKMMYELVDVVLELGERVRDLEIKVGAYNGPEANRKKEDVLMVMSKRGVARPRRDRHGNRIPVTTAGTE